MLPCLRLAAIGRVAEETAAADRDIEARRPDRGQRRAAARRPGGPADAVPVVQRRADRAAERRRRSRDALARYGAPGVALFILARPVPAGRILVETLGPDDLGTGGDAR